MHLPDFKKLGSSQTRANALRWMRKQTFDPLRSSLKWILCVVVAWLLSLLPFIQDAVASGDLSQEGLWMFRIMILAAGLWLTEAIPSYATAMLVMALELMFLSTAGASNMWQWSDILAVWGSPLIWLFFGGFLIAEAFREVGLDRVMAKFILARTGKNAVCITLGLMGVTYVLSMFMSNTATITVIIAVLAPMLTKVQGDPKPVRGLLLALALAASLGGMVTIVGTPPNAIAVASLADKGITIDFLQWMKIAGPPSIVLMALGFCYIWFCYFKGQGKVGLSAMVQNQNADTPIKNKKAFFFVTLIVLSTIAMWLTQSLHHMSPTVVVFFAITLLTLTGVITAVSLKSVPWDVLILMAGGLALGKGISVSGLATFLSNTIPSGLSLVTLGITFAFVAVVASNFMSNTAAANALIPLVFSVTAIETSLYVVIPATLACSCATLLPVSTPPNAICYATGKLRTSDFIKLGILMIVIGPIIAYSWCSFMI